MALLMLIGMQPLPVRAQDASEAPGSERPDAPYEPGRIFTTPTDTMVASVDGRSILLSDVANAIQDLPPDARKLPFKTLFPVLLDGLIAHAAMAVEAVREGLDTDPGVQARLRTAADRVLERALLERKAAQAVSAEALTAEYNRLFQGRAQIDVRRVQLMLLPNREEAERIGAALKAGGGFADLARHNSLDSSGPQGGDVGFVRKDQLPDGIGEGAFSAEPGAVVIAPSPTMNGWYLLRVGEQRQQPTPDFASVKDTLRVELMRQAAMHAVLQAQSRAVVRRFNMDGTPMDPAPDPGGPPTQ